MTLLEFFCITQKKFSQCSISVEMAVKTEQTKNRILYTKTQVDKSKV